MLTWLPEIMKWISISWLDAGGRGRGFYIHCRSKQNLQLINNTINAACRV